MKKLNFTETQNTIAESNLLKKTVKADKPVLKAPKRTHPYILMQKAKKPIRMRVSEDVVTNK